MKQNFSDGSSEKSLKIPGKYLKYILNVLEKIKLNWLGTMLSLYNNWIDTIAASIQQAHDWMNSSWRFH